MNYAVTGPTDRDYDLGMGVVGVMLLDVIKRPALRAFTDVHQEFPLPDQTVGKSTADPLSLVPLVLIPICFEAPVSPSTISATETQVVFPLPIVASPDERNATA